MKKNKTKLIKKNNRKNDVISSRKSCKVQGTGLSHYIMLDKKSKTEEIIHAG